MFQILIDLFTSYFNECYEDPMNSEILRKLKQLDYLYNKALSLHESAFNFGHLQEPPYKDLFELEIVTESFYHFSWRLREILKRHPSFMSFEAKNIRDVRNHLIMHSDKHKSPKLEWSFSVNEITGPLIKDYRRNKDSYVDKGLFENAKSFCSDLERQFRSVQPIA